MSVSAEETFLKNYRSISSEGRALAEQFVESIKAAEERVEAGERIFKAFEKVCALVDQRMNSRKVQGDDAAREE